MRLGTHDEHTLPYRLSNCRNPFRVRSLVAALTLVLVLLQAHMAIAEEQAVLNFLRIQPDVRARGMGEAAVGLTEIACPYASNPGALALRENSILSVGGGTWLPEYDLDLTYFCAGLAGPITDFASAALSLRAFNSGQIVRRFDLGHVDQYHSFDLAAGGSLALELDPNLVVGTTVSLLYSKLSDPYPEQNFGSGSATSVAFDLGFLIHDLAPQATITGRRESTRRYDPAKSQPARGIAVGLALQNLGPDIDHTDPKLSGPIPHNLAIGASYRLADMDNLGATLSLEVDGSLVDDGTDFMDKLALGIGAEVNLSSFVDGRIGHFMDPETWEGVTTLGLSVGPEQLRFNLSHIPESDVALSQTTFFSLSVRPSAILPHSGRCGP